MLDVPERYLEAAPVIVTSPTTRCGTTLVQRLLSASDNAFLYGEEVGKHIVTLTQSILVVMRHIEQNGASLDGHLTHALSGAMDDWQPGLMAPSQVMLRGWIETYYQLPMVLADYGRSIGRPIWGFKWPASSREVTLALMMLMPRAKVIYVFRNPFDALKSAKARKFVQSKEDTARFCAAWAKNMEEIAALEQDERVLLLRYEDMLRNRAGCADLLELFTGAKNTDRGVFDIKVNTFLGDTALGYSPSRYIEPDVLTDADRKTVHARAGSMLGRYFPDIPL